MNGLEQPVQDYVLSQPLAREFIDSCQALLQQLLPRLAEDGIREFTIAIGCTGGQHRSVSVTEIIARKLQESCPDYMIRICHRELDARAGTPENFSDDSCSNET
jgi:RNase adapter protein RapZ